MLIDSHCHLDFPEFKNDLIEVIKRAEEAGIKIILNPGCNFATSRKAVELAQRFENIYAAVGVHPHDSIQINKESIQELEELAQNKKVVAIGEIGLDYFRMRNTREVQLAAFEKQLELAQKLNKPVIIHSRESDEDIFKILDKFISNKSAVADNRTNESRVSGTNDRTIRTSPSGELRGVFHCFGGNWDFAEQVLAKGFLIGLTGIVTFPGAKNTHEVAKKIPLDKLLVETDAPFLAPQKHRGQRCEPAYVAEVAEKIAELKGVSVEEVAEVTTKNSEELFKILPVQK